MDTLHGGQRNCPELGSLLPPCGPRNQACKEPPLLEDPRVHSLSYVLGSILLWFESKRLSTDSCIWTLNPQVVALFWGGWGILRRRGLAGGRWVLRGRVSGLEVCNPTLLPDWPRCEQAYASATSFLLPCLPHHDVNTQNLSLKPSSLNLLPVRHLVTTVSKAINTYPQHPTSPHAQRIPAGKTE